MKIKTFSEAGPRVSSNNKNGGGGNKLRGKLGMGVNRISVFATARSGRTNIY